MTLLTMRRILTDAGRRLATRYLLKASSLLQPWSRSIDWLIGSTVFGLFTLFPFLRAASYSPKGRPEPDLSDPTSLRVPDMPAFTPAFDPEVDTTSKTTVSVLSDEESDFLLINAYSTVGFHLTNNVRAYGPIALFPKSVFQWNVSDVVL